jgi:hypothetical protein
MSFPYQQHPDDVEDPFHGTPQQEAHKEMIQEWGRHDPEAEWVLTDYDVWEKNPYFTGVSSGRHPEDDYYPEDDFIGPPVPFVSSPIE